MANTKHGYDHYELLSALQKSIRRGLEYEAVHFAVELEEFNPTMLWNRLRLMACEDVGPANPMMPVFIDIMQKNYLAEKPKLGENSYKLYLVNAVVCLCFSQKSRISDDLLNVVYTEREKKAKRCLSPSTPLTSIPHAVKPWAKASRTSLEKATNWKTKLSATATPSGLRSFLKSTVTKNKRAESRLFLFGFLDPVDCH